MIETPEKAAQDIVEYSRRVNRAAGNAMQVIRAEFANDKEILKVSLQGRAVLRLFQQFFRLVEYGGMATQAKAEKRPETHQLSENKDG